MKHSKPTSKKKTAAICGAVFVLAAIGTSAATGSDGPKATGSDPWNLGLASEAPATEAEPVAENTEAPETTYSAPTTVDVPPLDMEGIYLDVIEAGGYQIDDATALDLGNSICLAFDSDGTYLEVTDILMDSGFSAYDAGYIAGAAVINLCPEHAGELTL